MKNLYELLKDFFDMHPWDWVLHGFMGFGILMTNFFIIKWIFVYESMFASIFGAVNFLVAVEVIQLLTFGVNKGEGRQCTVTDYIVDVVVGLVGVFVAFLVFN